MSVARWLSVVPLVILAGCSSPRSVDDVGVGAAIAAELQPHLAPEEISSVECPPDVPVEAGGRFTCVVHVAEESVDVAVTQKSTGGDITFAPQGAVVVTEVVRADLDRRLHDAYDQPGDVMDLDVDCGGPAVRVLAVGDTFDCDVTAGGSTFVERVAVVDAAGTVSYLVVE